jgi:hypothetical protein
MTSKMRPTTTVTHSTHPARSPDHRGRGMLKLAMTAALMGAAGACAPAAETPSSAALPTVLAQSPDTSPDLEAVRMAVAGSNADGQPLRELTVRLPSPWTLQGGPYAASRGPAGPPAGTSLFVSLVDNTFEDPCSHVERSPKIGATGDELAIALGQIPGTTATNPVHTTVAGRPAMYLEITIPPTLPCEPTRFNLWQDSPGNAWWALGAGETIRTWIIDADGQRIAIAARSYPGTSEQAEAEVDEIVNSMVFDAAT